MGGRLGLCEPCRTGAQGARRRDAGEFLDRSADLPGRLGLLSSRRASRSAWPTRPSASTWRARSPSSSTTCRWAPALDEARDAIRLVMLVNDVSLRELTAGRTRQGFRLLPVEAVLGLFAGRGDAGRTGRRLGWRQAAPAAARRPQRQAVRPRQCRRRHDLRFPGADRPCGEDPAAGGRHHHRLGHRLQQAGRRAGQAGRRKAAPAIPASPNCA